MSFEIRCVIWTYSLFLFLLLTASVGLFAGVPLVAWATDAITRRAWEDRNPIVAAGGTAARVKLLQILINGSLQVGQSVTYVVSSCADTYKLMNRHDLVYRGCGTETGREERGKFITRRCQQCVEINDNQIYNICWRARYIIHLESYIILLIFTELPHNQWVLGYI